MLSQLSHPAAPAFCLLIKFILNSLCCHSHIKWEVERVSVLCEAGECWGGQDISGVVVSERLQVRPQGKAVSGIYNKQFGSEDRIYIFSWKTLNHKNKLDSALLMV